MSDKISNAQKAMRTLGSIGGQANLKKNGRAHMKKISNDYWRGKKKNPVENEKGR